jgi:hypothetical protein
MKRTWQFLCLAYQTYCTARAKGVGYGALLRHGVPQVCIYVGYGREAWRVSQIAVSEYKEYRG